MYYKNPNLLNFAITVERQLYDCSPEEFAETFMFFKGLYWDTYANNFICSSSHGIDFFKNIISYWEIPEKYCNDKQLTYEYNFVLMLNSNKL